MARKIKDIKERGTEESNLVLRKTMQAQFLQAYEDRAASDRIDQLASKNNIPWKEVQLWLQDDPDFVKKIAESDNRRISLVRNIVVGAIEDIARKMVESALGDTKHSPKDRQLALEVAGVMAGRRGQGVSIFNKIEVGADKDKLAEEKDPQKLRERLAEIERQRAEIVDAEYEDKG